MNMKNYTLKEAKELSEKALQTELGKRSKYLEELGMERRTSQLFVTSTANLAIALQQAWDAKKK